MKTIHLAAIFSTAALISLTALSQSEPNNPEERPSSRIRVFGQNGAGSKIYPGMSCHQSFFSSAGIKVSGGFGDAFSSFAGTIKNTSIGMPETVVSKNLSTRDGALSKAYFKEFEIPGNKPTTLTLGFKDVDNFYPANGTSIHTSGASCTGDIYFISEPAKDYEVGFTRDGKACYLSVNEIVKKDGENIATLIPVEVRPAPACE